MPTPKIDLNAGRREAQYPDGIDVTLGSETFLLPAELPADLLDPLLSDDLDLAGLIKKGYEKRLAAEASGADGDESLGSMVVDMLLDRPDLPKRLVESIKDVFRVLFDHAPEYEGQFARFVTQRPSINDYVRLAQALMPLYGVGLGEASASPASSESGGATLSATSSDSTDSTPEASGSDPALTGS